MVEHKVGGLYIASETRDSYLGILTLSGEKQLLECEEFNIKQVNGENFFLFNDVQPAMGCCYNPLESSWNVLSLLGEVDISSMQPLDFRVSEYIANLDPRRKFMNGISQGDKIIVVMPFNFEEYYSF